MTMVSDIRIHRRKGEVLRRNGLPASRTTKADKRVRAFSKKTLSPAEIALLEKRMRELFGPQVWEYIETTHFDVRATIAFMAVSTRCREARESKNFSIKQVAGVLRVPQYRLRQIEEGHIGQIDSEILQSYVTFLGLKRWFGRWKAVQAKVMGK